MRVSLMLVLLGACVAAQQTPMFRTATTLIEFSVVAVDGDGQPVTDLTRDDISIAEEGNVREVAFFPIRLIVRDRVTSRYGTLDVPVNRLSRQ